MRIYFVIANQHAVIANDSEAICWNEVSSPLCRRRRVAAAIASSWKTPRNDAPGWK